jgi:TetR/AcrR family transcriptional regulator, transcriptional repressor for nem operon
MARPKEFERETALQAAIGVFAEHGFEGTSTEDLLQAMAVSRQSMYDTFGDKRQLYLEALQRYTTDSISTQIRVLGAAPSALRGLEAHVYHAVDQAIADPSPRCLGISAICEFGTADPEVARLTDKAARTLFSALKRRLSEAKEGGEIPRDIDITDAATFLQATLSGIKVAARGGASAPSLRGIARMALRTLQ